jgi:hypothetical protein
MPKLSDVYASDPDASENGRWLDLRPATKKVKALRVKVRSLHSKVCRREDAKLDKKYRVQYLAGNGILDPETQDEKEVLFVSRGVLVDWDNFVGDDDQPLPFKPEVVQATLREFPQLRREILMLARMDDNFRPPELVAAEREGMAGN